MPASVADFDARPTGDQEVWSAIFFRGDLSIKYFLR